MVFTITSSKRIHGDAPNQQRKQNTMPRRKTESLEEFQKKNLEKSKIR